jgi:hypothetical protein
MPSLTRDIPCPCCGFLTLEGEYGSYAICPLCDWEDDGVQLANPTSEGGANKESLVQAQAAAVEKYPVHVQLAGSFRRSTSWRPLLPSEIEAFNREKESKHWHKAAVLAENEAYWQLSVHDNQPSGGAQ